MTTVKDVYEYLDSIAPFSGQLDFDNSGFLVGDPDKVVTSLCVALDITADTVAQAKYRQSELIVSHHPVIYKSKRSFIKGDLPYELVSAGISAICAHTSLDCAVDGVNDVLADILSLTKVEAVPTNEIPVPMVRVGFLQKPMTAFELAAFVSQELECKLRWCDGGKEIETVAVCGGSGGKLIADICELGVDALVTGDADYHSFLDAAAGGLTLIAAGHFETEFPIVPVIAEKLQARFPEIEVTALSQKPTIKHM